MSEEYGPNFVTLTDEEGNDIELEYIDALEHNGTTYMAFFPVVEEGEEENEDEYGLIILKSETVDGEEMLANVVDEADTGSWDLMWNPKYAGNILQFNNARDALGTAMYRANIDVNTTDRNDWQQALQALIDQRPIVKSYVMDEIYNMMESGEAAVAAYYAGDYFTMCDAQADSVDLQFYYPENTNYFIDAMCIPTGCRDQELAECFINFMLSREAAVANAEYIYYASPNRLVYDDPEYIDDMGEDTMAILYPNIGSFRDAYNRSAYRNLDQDTLTYVNRLWETLKIN